MATTENQTLIEGASTFEQMAVLTCQAFLLAIREFERQNDRVPIPEESISMLMNILKPTFEAIFEGTLKVGVDAGAAIANAVAQYFVGDDLRTGDLLQLDLERGVVVKAHDGTELSVLGVAHKAYKRGEIWSNTD